MKLSDVMSAMNLAVYAEVALVLFLVAFFMVSISLFRQKERQQWERARYMPLSDATDEQQPRQPDATRGST